MPSDPLNLEPKNGDFVDYIESLPDEPMTASVSKI